MGKEQVFRSFNHDIVYQPIKSCKEICRKRIAKILYFDSDVCTWQDSASLLTCIAVPPIELTMNDVLCIEDKLSLFEGIVPVHRFSPFMK